MPSQPITQPVWLRRLQTPQRISALEPLSARFIYALRLMATYRTAERDPAAELAVRLQSVTTAIHAIEFAEGLLRAWPESIVVNRFCCQALSHDEATIASLVTAAAERDRGGFEAQLEGLVHPARIAPLWRQSLLLVGAEMSCQKS